MMIKLKKEMEKIAFEENQKQVKEIKDKIPEASDQKNT